MHTLQPYAQCRQLALGIVYLIPVVYTPRKQYAQCRQLALGIVYLIPVVYTPCSRTHSVDSWL